MSDRPADLQYLGSDLHVKYSNMSSISDRPKSCANYDARGSLAKTRSSCNIHHSYQSVILRPNSHEEELGLPIFTNGTFHFNVIIPNVFLPMLLPHIPHNTERDNNHYLYLPIECVIFIVCLLLLCMCQQNLFILCIKCVHNRKYLSCTKSKKSLCKALA